MEIVYSTSRSHNTPLWVSVRFSLKRIYTPHCQSSGELPSPVTEDEAWGKKALEMRGGSSHISGGQAFLDLTLIGSAGKTIAFGGGVGIRAGSCIWRKAEGSEMWLRNISSGCTWPVDSEWSLLGATISYSLCPISISLSICESAPSPLVRVWALCVLCPEW